MRRRAESSATTEAPRPAPKFVPVSVYSHVSTYRSLKLELQLYSPSLKVHEDGRGPIAVFSDHDQVGGKVTVDSSNSSAGRLTVSIEGAFTSPSPDKTDPDATSDPACSEPQKHTFLSTTTTINISNSEAGSPRSTFREAFVRRRPSISGISFNASSSERSHPFTFYLPRSMRPGEEMPASFSGVKGSSDGYEVTYKIVSEWEPHDPFETPSRLEVPFLIQPDADFQCAEASLTTPGSWLEMPLKSERPIPLRCAITLPTSVTFSRSSSIPYFVVFTTTPRSPALAKEIAADATISVSLIRQIVVSEQCSLPPTPPLTPTSEESEPQRSRLLYRVTRAQARRIPRRISESAISFSRDKPLPQLPVQKTFSDSRTIHSDLCIGFPKRPRQQCDSKSHPSLEEVAALPDGLHKTRIQLSADMLPCIDWQGISVKYYLDVSVLIGPDDLRARIPIRIF
ncbi:hypothetical protein B0H34DRAFT_798928 [Crassisporium funariophilum]|nr:hypothetical protein B0H34DRAFT_798928 [Crassisporium funariophilum]